MITRDEENKTKDNSFKFIKQKQICYDIKITETRETWYKTCENKTKKIEDVFLQRISEKKVFEVKKSAINTKHEQKIEGINLIKICKPEMQKMHETRENDLVSEKNKNTNENVRYVSKNLHRECKIERKVKKSEDENYQNNLNIFENICNKNLKNYDKQMKIDDDTNKKKDLLHIAKFDNNKHTIDKIQNNNENKKNNNRKNFDLQSTIHSSNVHSNNVQSNNVQSNNLNKNKKMDKMRNYDSIEYSHDSKICSKPKSFDIQQQFNYLVTKKYKNELCSNYTNFHGKLCFKYLCKTPFYYTSKQEIVTENEYKTEPNDLYSYKKGRNKMPDDIFYDYQNISYIKKRCKVNTKTKNSLHTQLQKRSKKINIRNLLVLEKIHIKTKCKLQKK